MIVDYDGIVIVFSIEVGEIVVVGVLVIIIVCFDLCDVVIDVLDDVVGYIVVGDVFEIVVLL